MNEVIKAINTRRAIKAYTDKKVSKSDIETICQAGLMAPTGKGEQSSIIVAVTDPDQVKKLSDANRAVMGPSVPASLDPFYGAGTVLCVLAKKDWFTHVEDGSLALGSMMLAAHSLGLGSCWIHRAKEVFAQDEWKKWLASKGVKGDYEGVGFCIVGYPATSPEAAPRKPDRLFWA